MMTRTHDGMFVDRVTRTHDTPSACRETANSSNRAADTDTGNSVTKVPEPKWRDFWERVWAEASKWGNWLLRRLRINLPGGRLRHNLEWTAWKLWDLRNWEVPQLEPRDLVSSNVSLCFSWLAYQTAPMYFNSTLGFVVCYFSGRSGKQTY